MGFIAPSMWDDERIRQLGDPEKLIWIYLLTGPESIGCPGLVRAGVATLADAMRKELDDVRNALHNLRDIRLIDLDLERRVIRVPNAPKYNAPRNPNILTGSWFKRWQQVPNESPLKLAHIPSVRLVIDRLVTDAERDKEPKVAKSWRNAWDLTFGSVNPRHISTQGALFDSLTEPSPGLKSLSNHSTNGHVNDVSGLLLGSGSGEVATERATMKDQGVKSFPEQSDPDLDPCPDPDPDPDPDLPGKNSSAQIVPLRARARRFWEAQERLRAELPGQQPITATAANLELVEACLVATSASDEDVEMVLDQYATVSKAFFNGRSNWNPENFSRALTIAETRKRKNSTKNFKPTGRETYAGGKVV